MGKTTASAALFLLVVFLVGCDHGTKRMAERHLRGKPRVELISGVLELRYTENRDAAFSLLRELPPPTRRALLLSGRLVVCLALLAAVALRRRLGLHPVGLALALAGGLGNVVEYLLRGFVVDFIHVSHWPVFNVADVCLGVGVGLLLLGEQRRRRARASG
jgi:signal peptidase II